MDQDVPEEKSERILFKGDGTYKWYWYLGSYGWQSSNYIHKYEVSGNKIILYASNGDIGDTYRVVSIKGDVVVLEVTLDEGLFPGTGYIQQRTIWKCQRQYFSKIVLESFA